MNTTYRIKFRPLVWNFIGVLLTVLFVTGNYGPKARLYDYVAPEEAEWIRCSNTDQYTACFRREIELDSEVRNGWLAVVSNGGFELLCNGNPVGAQTYWRPTRIFQNGLTEPGQRLVNSEPIVAYNFPREYQWSGHDNTQVATLFDLRPYLKKGKNCISIEAEGRTVQPEVLAFGSAETKSGRITSIITDKSWYAEPVPVGLGQNNWTKPLYDVSHWQRAELGEIQRKQFVSAVPPGVFDRPFQGDWVIKNANEGTASFRAEAFLTNPINGQFRIVVHSGFWLWVNGVRVEPLGGKETYNGEEWSIGWGGRRPLATPPVLLDPDEVGDFFSGHRFEDPRHGDPTVNDFKKFENTLNRTRERPNQTGGDLTSDGDEEKGREQDPYGFYEEADAAKPLALLRKGGGRQYHSYDISGLLEPGENTFEIKLVESASQAYEGSQSLKFAVDGLCKMVNGEEFDLSQLEWKNEEGAAVQNGYKAQPNDLPLLEFYQSTQGSTSTGVRFVVILFCVIAASILSGLFPRIWKYNLVYSLLLCFAALLAFSLAERSEYVWFLKANRGPLFVVGAFLLALLTLHGGKWLRRTHIKGERSKLWLIGLLILVFLTRGWMVHFQPIDDDEYASIQAVLAIAETGVPTLADEIWYSRSPLYHYVAAGVVKVFGPHIWSLRLYSVLLGVLTALVIWRIATRYFSDRWIAYASLLIYALHPFLIFSSHIARFYQQQQLLVLLMIYLFIEGFIRCSGMWYRIGAIVLFTLSVLSQEISVSFVPVFLFVYLLFGKGVPVRWDVKSVIYIGISAALIAADILLFKVKCITDSVGVSPNVEATLAPTFWELGNIGSMFIGYSRLHIVLGVFYFFSFIYSLRRGSSVVITLHAVLILSVVLFNFLITSVSFRYMYSVIPLWIVLGVHGVMVLSKWVAAQSKLSAYLTWRWIALAVVICSMSPWRIVHSYTEKILGDPISSLGYVRGQLRPSDKVMITEPHPHAAKIELGRVDYDLVVPILYDFTYRSNGVLRDRNGDAVVVNRLAELQKIFSNEERVWVILNREKFRSRKKNIRWEYPGAREELFIRQNCELKYRSYLWAVYLWDQSSGKFDTFRKEPDGWSE